MSTPRLDHIAIAVANLEEALRFYAEALSLVPEPIEEVEEQGVRLAKLAVANTRIELLEPLSKNTPVGKFLQERGPGLHHICLGVDDIVSQLTNLQSRGVRLINQTPVQGAGGASIAFLHPKSSGGVLIELSQPKAEQK